MSCDVIVQTLSLFLIAGLNTVKILDYRNGVLDVLLRCSCKGDNNVATSISHFFLTAALSFPTQTFARDENVSAFITNDFVNVRKGPVHVRVKPIPRTRLALLKIAAEENERPHVEQSVHPHHQH